MHSNFSNLSSPTNKKAKGPKYYHNLNNSSPENNYVHYQKPNLFKFIKWQELIV